MNTQEFYRIIQGEVAKEVSKQLPKILKEAVNSFLQEALDTTKKTALSKKQISSPFQPVVRSGNPILEALEETKHSMEPSEFLDIANNTSRVNFPTSRQQLVNINEGFAGEEIEGVDLSGLDFVKNAARVYKTSIEKDKEKYGNI